jgi:hypothetical protein
MPSAAFEPAIPDRTATRIGWFLYVLYAFKNHPVYLMKWETNFYFSAMKFATTIHVMTMETFQITRTHVGKTKIGIHISFLLLSEFKFALHSTKLKYVHCTHCSSFWNLVMSLAPSVINTRDHDFCYSTLVNQWRCWTRSMKLCSWATVSSCCLFLRCTEALYVVTERIDGRLHRLGRRREKCECVLKMFCVLCQIICTSGNKLRVLIQIGNLVTLSNVCPINLHLTF